MKYKEGDRVLIKSIDWYNENKDEDGDVPCGEYDFVYPMTKFCGKILTIDVDFEDGTYQMAEDRDGFVFTNEMIERLVEEEDLKPKFKIGDKVILDPYPCVVTDVTWRDSLHGFVYTVRGTDFGKTVKEDDLVFDESQTLTTDKIVKNIKADWDNFKSRYNLPNGYHFVDKNGNEINISEIVFEKKKPKYPKTYEECSLITGYEDRIPLKIIGEFTRLINARNAYWKLYGEEMGLGKPWKPDLTDNVIKHCIEFRDCGVCKVTYSYTSKILSFPTAEMRDAFYECFKSEIEMCKELL